MNAAAFNLLTNTGVTTFFAYLDGVLVESFSAATQEADRSRGHYYGFTRILFDEIRFSIASFNTAFALDNLNFQVAPPSAVPIPGALPLFASVLGLGGFFGWKRKRKAAA